MPFHAFRAAASSTKHQLRRIRQRLRIAFVGGERQLGLPAEMTALIPSGMSALRAANNVLKKTRTFDAQFYLNQVPSNLEGEEAPSLHFLESGWRSGLAPIFYFDPEFYLSQGGTCGEDVNPLFHYLYVGESKGLRPSQYFDPTWYRTRYALTTQSPLCHYLAHRYHHILAPNPEFDIQSHLERHPELRGQGEDPFMHHLRQGQNENATENGAATKARVSVFRHRLDFETSVKTIVGSQIFDADWYRHRSNLKIESRKDLAYHYLTAANSGAADPSPLFDRKFYLRAHAKEIGAIDPLVHYIREGWKRNFDPHPLFSVSFYLEQNDDVRDAGREPLSHYLESGWREGRSPCEEFDTVYYIANNTDVREQGCEPLRHFLEYGAVEGRKPSQTFDTAWYLQHVLKGETANPLIHFRSRAGNKEDLNRRIPLSRGNAMSTRDFYRWIKFFPEADAPRPFGIELVRACGATDLKRSEAETDRDDRVDESKRHYLICDRADELNPQFAAHFESFLAQTDLGIFDFAFQVDGMWVPVLLPGANPTHIEAVDATFSRFVISQRLLRLVEFTADMSTHDLLKAALAKLRNIDRLDRFKHLPIPILRAEDLSETLQAERRSLARSFHTSPLTSTVLQTNLSISVVICSKDKCRLLSQLLDRLLERPEHTVREIVVVTNSAPDSFASEIHAAYREKARIEFLRSEGPYNFSIQSNRGAARCSGDLLLFLNDDIVPIVPHWLEALSAPFARPEVGATGPMLLYPDERIQHAGMYLGYNEIAGHTLRGARLPDEDFMFLGSAPRNVSAVTGAALLTRRTLFDQLNGFDRQLGTYLQDVDYCLRMLACGHEIIYDPRALLFHMESVSMREGAEVHVFGDRRPLEFKHFMRRWSEQLGHDVYHNVHFDKQQEQLRSLTIGAVNRLPKYDHRAGQRSL